MTWSVLLYDNEERFVSVRIDPFSDLLCAEEINIL
jgi:hypothetical protein